MEHKESFELADFAGMIEKIRIDTGKEIEVFLPKKRSLSLPFENEFCHFKPVGWARLNGIWYPLGYKIVTNKMESLGLRNNPNIMKFPVGHWVEEKNELIPSQEDKGGIWTALRKSSIRTLQKHCWETWGMETRGFLTAIYNPVYANTYRIKSEAVMTLKEVCP